jgi:hypothetical protein
MKHAVIGVRMHSGWGALVAVANSAGTVEIVDRRRVTVIDSRTPGAKQPYHYAVNLKLPKAEKFLADCVAASERLASIAVREWAEELRNRHYSVAGCAVVLASGRPLPPLPKILASHALIHTAEGEFFRQAIWKACEGLDIAVTGLREPELDQCVRTAFGKAATQILQQISTLGRSLGPPWTSDQKTATMAALVVLGNAF